MHWWYPTAGLWHHAYEGAEPSAGVVKSCVTVSAAWSHPCRETSARWEALAVTAVLRTWHEDSYTNVWLPLDLLYALSEHVMPFLNKGTNGCTPRVETLEDEHFHVIKKTRVLITLRCLMIDVWLFFWPCGSLLRGSSGQTDPAAWRPWGSGLAAWRAPWKAAAWDGGDGKAAPDSDDAEVGGYATKEACKCTRRREGLLGMVCTVFVTRSKHSGAKDRLDPNKTFKICNDAHSLVAGNITCYQMMQITIVWVLNQTQIIVHSISQHSATWW